MRNMKLRYNYCKICKQLPVRNQYILYRITITELFYLYNHAFNSGNDSLYQYSDFYLFNERVHLTKFYLNTVQYNSFFHQANNVILYNSQALSVFFSVSSNISVIARSRFSSKLKV